MKSKNIKQISDTALVIMIQSWATPLVAVLALVAGLFIGYLVYPAMNQKTNNVISKLEGTSNPTAIIATFQAKNYSTLVLEEINATNIPNSTGSDNQPQNLTTTATKKPTPVVDAEKLQNAVDQAHHFMGDENAPVKFIMFSDFQCPYCARFATTSAPQIVTEYVDTGLVRLAYFHAAFLGDKSKLAAEASECAGEQSEQLFWNYHDKLFESRSGETKMDLTSENLKLLAVELGLNTQVFDQCLDTGKYAALVDIQTNMAREYGLLGVPSFFINTQYISGAKSFEVFQGLIETAMK